MDFYDSMTLGEIEEFETIADCAIDEIAQPGQVKGKIYQALTFVIGKRKNPALTLAEVKAMTRTEADALFEAGSDPK